MDDQETKPASVLLAAMNYGALLGVSQVIISLIFYVLGKGGFMVPDLLYAMVTMGAVFFGVRNFRDTNYDGYISFGEALKLGTLITLFGSIVFSFVYYLYLKFVDSTVAVATLAQTEQWMLDHKYSQTEIDLGMPVVRKNVMFILFLSSILVYTIYGFILSLVISFFTKRNEDVFENKLNN